MNKELHKQANEIRGRLNYLQHVNENDAVYFTKRERKQFTADVINVIHDLIDFGVARFEDKLEESE